MRRVLVIVCCLVANIVGLTAQAPWARILITVLDQNRRPIEGATISITDIDNRPVGSLATDHNGTALMHVQPGNYEFRVTAPGYQPQWADHKIPGGDSNVRFALSTSRRTGGPTEGVISGRVLTMENEPVVGARVVFSGFSLAEPTFTDADGNYRASLLEGTYTVTVHPDLRARSPAPAVTYLYEQAKYPVSVPVKRGHLTAGIDIHVHVQPRFRITVRLLDSAGRIPKAATVLAFAERPGSSLMPGFGADATGTGSVGPFFPGPVTILAMSDAKPRLVAALRVDIQDRPLDVDLVLRPGSQLAGHVEFVGLDRPPQGRQRLRIVIKRTRSMATWRGPEGLVDKDGRFLLSDLAGDACLDLYGIPEGWQLAAIADNGLDITETPMSFDPPQHFAGVVFTVVPHVGAPVLRRPCDPLRPMTP